MSANADELKNELYSTLYEKNPHFMVHFKEFSKTAGCYMKFSRGLISCLTEADSRPAMLAFHRFSNFCDTIRTSTDFIAKFSELEKVLDDTPEQGISLEPYACAVISEHLSSTVPALNPSVSTYTNLARLLDVVINSHAKQPTAHGHASITEERPPQGIYLNHQGKHVCTKCTKVVADPVNHNGTNCRKDLPKLNTGKQTQQQQQQQQQPRVAGGNPAQGGGRGRGKGGRGGGGGGPPAGGHYQPYAHYTQQLGAPGMHMGFASYPPGFAPGQGFNQALILPAVR